jgi:hypothetical protein
MTRNEFEQLRDLPNKTVIGDIAFISTSNPAVLRAECRIDNSLNYDAILNATFNQLLPSLIFNFRIQSVGAICRFCINGVEHQDAITKQYVRNHKHSLQTENCPTLNIPYAVERTDFDITSQDIRDIWSKICLEANINHQGQIII